jgi:hypothetical protein
MPYLLSLDRIVPNDNLFIGSNATCPELVGNIVARKGFVTCWGLRAKVLFVVLY